jgi:hypothetical protein
MLKKQATQLYENIVAMELEKYFIKTHKFFTMANLAPVKN